MLLYRQRTAHDLTFNENEYEMEDNPIKPLPRLNKSQREQLHALITKAWWPFDRADPKVLNLMHLSIVERKKSTTDLPEALL